MTDALPTDRCRLVLIAPPGLAARRLAAALSGGDVASVILPQGGLDADAFQDWAEALVPVAQAAGAAAIVAGDSRVAGRTKADGLHVEGGAAAVAEAVEKARGRLAIGAGGAKTRDDALVLGEAGPDYLFFGRFGYDNQPEPHPRNLSLGRWWAEMIEIPCIVLGGSAVASVDAVAAAGAEFVALSAAVFADGVDGAAAVAEANARIDGAAQRAGAQP